MVPKTTKCDHDGKEREANRLHTALLFLLSTPHISCSQRVSFSEIETMMRMLLEAPHRVRYGNQAKVGGILWSDELDIVGILLNIGCKELALVGAIHEHSHDSPDGDSDSPSLSCVLDMCVTPFLIIDTACPPLHGSICLSSLVCFAHGCRIHRDSLDSVREEPSTLRLARAGWPVQT